MININEIKEIKNKEYIEIYLREIKEMSEYEIQYELNKNEQLFDELDFINEDLEYVNEVKDEIENLISFAKDIKKSENIQKNFSNIYEELENILINYEKEKILIQEKIYNIFYD